MSIAEVMVVFIVAIFAFGPNKLPLLARHLAQLINYLEQYKQKANSYIEEELMKQQLEENEKKANHADKTYQNTKSQQ